MFLDGSTRSLKVMLLHNSNEHPSIPIAHFVHLKEDNYNIKRPLLLQKYGEHDFEVIGDLKMSGFLTDL